MKKQKCFAQVNALVFCTSNCIHFVKERIYSTQSLDSRETMQTFVCIRNNGICWSKYCNWKYNTFNFVMLFYIFYFNFLNWLAFAVTAVTAVAAVVIVVRLLLSSLFQTIFRLFFEDKWRKKERKRTIKHLKLSICWYTDNDHFRKTVKSVFFSFDFCLFVISFVNLVIGIFSTGERMNVEMF